MAASRSFAAVLLAVAGLALPALPAGAAAPRLTIETAVERSTRFAENTCEHDDHCVRHGVRNCRRESPNVVLCRIFDERDTPAQGRYRCHRLIRIAFDPASGRKPVTGLGRWHC